MLAFVCAFFAGLVSLASSSSAISPRSCTAAQRIAYAKQVPHAYAQPTIAQTYAAFAMIPFGAPNLAGPCTTTIYPNGGSGVLASYTGQGVVNFGTETRQAFSSVTGEYHDFGANGTAVIYTNVTLGVQSDVVIPVTFTAQVYLDFNTDCRIYAVRAFAQIPTYIDGKPTWLSIFLPVPETPLLL